jgi:hypothetical protein
VKLLGDFDGPAPAIHGAIEIRDRIHELGIEIRVGIHPGECEPVDGKANGIAVTTGARISALADPSQVLVSRTVNDLVAGGGFTFEPAGEHELKVCPIIGVCTALANRSLLSTRIAPAMTIIPASDSPTKKQRDAASASSNAGSTSAFEVDLDIH